ncbi:MAG TPA: hypothetical protein VGY55_15105 [Pirellulales bacterium]|nr:hypothetical protein [Pirellulales bacterium]
MDGSGTGAELSLPTDFPIARTATLALSVDAVLKLAELVSPASKGPLGATEVAKASPPELGSPPNRLAGEANSGLPEASLASIVTQPRLGDVPPIPSTD